MSQYPTTPDTAFSTPFSAEERVSAFLRSVYGWMCGGLAITALVAFFVASSPALVGTLIRTPFVLIGLVLAQLGLVFALSLRAQKMAAGTAAALFVAYSALTGVTMSFVLLAYTAQSVASTFAISASRAGSVRRPLGRALLHQPLDREFGAELAVLVGRGGRFLRACTRQDQQSGEHAPGNRIESTNH